MKRIILIIALVICLGVKYGYTQSSVAVHMSSVPKFGFSVNFSDRLWSEFRIYNFDSFSDFTPELVFCYNIVEKERHNIYLGLGGTINMYTGLALPLGVQFNPIKEFKRFSVQIEFLPITAFRDGFSLQSSFGIRYRLGERE